MLGIWLPVAVPGVRRRVWDMASCSIGGLFDASKKNADAVAGGKAVLVLATGQDRTLLVVLHTAISQSLYHPSTEYGLQVSCSFVPTSAGYVAGLRWPSNRPSSWSDCSVFQSRQQDEKHRPRAIWSEKVALALIRKKKCRIDHQGPLCRATGAQLLRAAMAARRDDSTVLPARSTVKASPTKSPGWWPQDG